jgi:hypothetical protein
VCHADTADAAGLGTLTREVDLSRHFLHIGQPRLLAPDNKFSTKLGRSLVHLGRPTTIHSGRRAAPLVRPDQAWTPARCSGADHDQAAQACAIYARVSTEDQTTDNQLLELRQVAERAGWEVVETYVDHAISGGKGRDQRPTFDRLHRDAAARQFDLVMAWSVDRLGRSLQHLVGFLAELHALRIDLYLHQQHVDTTTPAGRALFGMMSVFAEFERVMIQERGRAVLALARAQGNRPHPPRI